MVEGSKILIARTKKKLSQAQLADLMGLSQRTISSWEKGDRTISADQLQKLSEILGVGMSELAGCQSLTIRIPIYSTEASAGPGMWIDAPQVENFLEIREDIIRAELPGDPARLVIVRVKGDSMTPTIQPGEMVIIDSSEQSITADGIYALSINNNLVVKRVQQLVGAINIISDNKLYPVQKIVMAEIESVSVSGRVVGIISMKKV